MNSSNLTSASLNPAYVPGLAYAALVALHHGGSNPRSRPKGKGIALQFDIGGKPYVVAVNKFNFRSAGRKVAEKIGGEDTQLPPINQATLDAYKRPIFTAMVAEIARQRGQVEDFRFGGKVPTKISRP